MSIPDFASGFKPRAFPRTHINHRPTDDPPASARTACGPVHAFALLVDALAEGDRPRIANALRALYRRGFVIRVRRGKGGPT